MEGISNFWNRLGMKLLVSSCFPLPRFPPFKATANYPRLRWAGLCAEMGHSGPLKFPYLCHARKRNQGSDGFESFEHWFTASLMIFQASGLVAMGFRQKVWQPDFGQSCVTVCVLRHRFFQCFHGWSTDPFRKHRHLQAIWVGIGRFLCGRDASKGGRTLKFKAPLCRSP